MAEWQPMETAKKDGRRIWLAYSNGPSPLQWGMAACRYTDGGKGFCEPGWYLSPHGELSRPIYFMPTHWMEIKPPASVERTQEGGDG